MNKPINQYLLSKGQDKPKLFISSLVQTQVAIYTYSKNGKQIGCCSGFFIDNDAIISIKGAFYSVHKATIHSPTGDVFALKNMTLPDSPFILLHPELSGISGFYPKIPQYSELREGNEVYFSKNTIHAISSLENDIVVKKPESSYFQLQNHPGIPGILGAPVFNDGGRVIGVIVSSMENIIIAPILDILDGLDNSAIQKQSLPVEAAEELSEEARIGREFQYATELIYNKGKYNEALPVFRKIYRNYNLSEAYYYAAVCKSGHTRTDYGIRMMNKALQNNPVYVPYYRFLAEMYFSKQQYKKSIQCFEQIISIDQLNVPAYSGLIKSYEKLNNAEKASGIFREMLEKCTVRFEIDKFLEVRESRNGFLILRAGTTELYLLLHYTHVGVYTSLFDSDTIEYFAFSEYERFIEFGVNLITDADESFGLIRKEVEYSLRRVWNHFMYRTDGIVRGIQHCIYFVTAKHPKILLRPEFYQQPLLIKDIMRYKAAAVAVAFVEELCVKKKVKQLLLLPAYKQFQYEASKKGVSVQLAAAALKTSETELIKILKNWRDLYGVPSRRLNKTLSNLPHGLRASEICMMAEYTLPKALTNRTEYLFNMCYLAMDTDNERPFYLIITKAGEAEIVQGMGLVSEHLGRTLQLITGGIREYLRFICDYPNRYSGTLGGLTRHAITWHEQMAQIDAVKNNTSLDLDQKTALPPIHLPQDDNITFLSSVKEMVDEGKHMQHCVTNYAEKVCRGDYFLFRVTLSKSRATTLVDRKGNVVQSYGPRNSHNAASVYGKKILSKWGEQFPMNIGNIYISGTGDDE